MKCFLSVNLPIGGGKYATFEDVKSSLKKAGVTYGVDEKAIQKTLEAEPLPILEGSGNILD